MVVEEGQPAAPNRGGKRWPESEGGARWRLDGRGKCFRAANPLCAEHYPYSLARARSLRDYGGGSVCGQRDSDDYGYGRERGHHPESARLGTPLSERSVVVGSSSSLVDLCMHLHLRALDISVLWQPRTDSASACGGPGRDSRGNAEFQSVCSHQEHELWEVGGDPSRRGNRGSSHHADFEPVHSGCVGAGSGQRGGKRHAVGFILCVLPLSPIVFMGSGGRPRLVAFLSRPVWAVVPEPDLLPGRRLCAGETVRAGRPRSLRHGNLPGANSRQLPDEFAGTDTAAYFFEGPGRQTAGESYFAAGDFFAHSVGFACPGIHGSMQPFAAGTVLWRPLRRRSRAADAGLVRRVHQYSEWTNHDGVLWKGHPSVAPPRGRDHGRSDDPAGLSLCKVVRYRGGTARLPDCGVHRICLPDFATAPVDGN